MTCEPQFLVAAVRRFLDPDAPLDHPSTVDWTALLRLAEAHAVTPMLYKTMRDLSVPESAVRQLRSAYELTVARSLAQSAELARVIGLFEPHRIPVVALKGPLLSRYLYRDLGSRTSGDIDLLAKRDQIVEIRKLLLANGYQVKTTAHWNSNSACLRSRENQMSFASPSGVNIDVHWRLIPAFFASACDALDPWSNLQAVNLAGRSVQTLAPESLFLFLCSHGSKHMFERLGWICDIARFLTVTPDLDWSAVIDRAQRASALRQVLLSVHLAADLLGASRPSNLPVGSPGTELEFAL